MKELSTKGKILELIKNHQEDQEKRSFIHNLDEQQLEKLHSLLTSPRERELVWTDIEEEQKTLSKKLNQFIQRGNILKLQYKEMKENISKDSDLKLLENNFS